VVEINKKDQKRLPVFAGRPTTECYPVLRVDLLQAQPGMKLAMPVQNPKVVTRTLLKVGYELTEEAIERVGSLGVRSLWVAYPSLSAVEKYLSIESMKVQQDVVSRIADTFEEAQGQASAKMEYGAYSTSVKSMIDHVATNPKTAVFIGELADAADDLMRHAATVTYISILMGMKLDGYMIRERKHISPMRAKEIVNLGVGAMLHDFGMTLLPEGTLEKYKLEADESDPAYREHPALGFCSVRGQIDPSAASVVLHHHQRFDGSGFVGKDFAVKSGHSIHIYARIVAVADQFDRLRRPINLPEQPTVAVLNAMRSESMNPRFDPEVMRALIEVVPPYAPGSQLKLSDGRLAVCVDHNLHDPCRPMVQIIDSLDDFAVGEDSEDEEEHEDGVETQAVNLAEEPSSLFVAECDGQPVGEFNFTVEDSKAVA